MTEIDDINLEIIESRKNIVRHRREYYRNYPARKILAIIVVAAGYLVVVGIGGLWCILGAIVVFVGLMIGFFAWADNLPYALIFGDKVEYEKQKITDLKARKLEIMRSRKHV